MKDTDTDNVAIKQPGKDDKGNNEEWENTECINHKVVLQQYGHMQYDIDQTGFKNSDITAIRKTRPTVRTN